MTYLVVAYLALWLVHLGYVWSLGSRQRRLGEEMERLEEASRKDARRGGAQSQ